MQITAHSHSAVLSAFAPFHTGKMSSVSLMEDLTSTSAAVKAQVVKPRLNAGYLVHRIEMPEPQYPSMQKVLGFIPALIEAR
jgi:hypothetical protein